jgi:hypothetical protein
MGKLNPEGPIKLDLERWDRWVQWIKKVRIDLKSALVDRTVFRRFSDIVGENREWIAEHYGGRFCEFVARAHVARIASAVRRHSRSHRDAITLTGILEQMEKCAGQFTFDFFRERFPSGGEDHFTQRATFKYVSQDGRVASEALIRHDIEDLHELTTKVEAFVDKELAHLDRKGLATPATFNDLDSALDALDRMACRYLTLLTGGYRDTLAGTIQDPWEEIFTVPLIKPQSV